MGVESGQQLDMTNPDVMTQLIRGIATIEGGNPQVTLKTQSEPMKTVNELAVNLAMSL